MNCHLKDRWFAQQTQILLNSHTKLLERLMIIFNIRPRRALVCFFFLRLLKLLGFSSSRSFDPFDTIASSTMTAPLIDNATFVIVWMVVWEAHKRSVVQWRSMNERTFAMNREIRCIFSRSFCCCCRRQDVCVRWFCYVFAASHC